MTYSESIIKGINYLISAEDTTVQTPDTSDTAKFTGLLAIILGTAKTLLWGAIAVIVPVVLL